MSFEKVAHVASDTLVNLLIENCVLLKNDENPISLQERACKETTYPKNDKHLCWSYWTKVVARSSYKEKSGRRGGGGGNPSINPSKRLGTR